MADKPYVDKSVCIACELCVNLVPTVFRIGDDGLAEVFDPQGASREEIQKAVDGCPVSCIHWE